MGTPDVLTDRALNRATLARQLLLDRAELPVPEAVERLVGLQAQAPLAPYVGLWSRLSGFRPEALSVLLEDRSMVRIPLMRATVHMVTARECRALRALVQVVLERGFDGQRYFKSVTNVDEAAVAVAGRALLEAQPRTRAELGSLLVEQFPAAEPDALAYSLTYKVPLVQVPPRALWGRTGPATWTTVDAWLSTPDLAETHLAQEDLVLRYLAAFGPASVRDIQTWSGLTRLKAVADGLGERLVRFRAEDGRELLDLPAAPRPDPDHPAPPRFLPEYDNVLLSHADRRRIIDDGRRVPLPPGNGAAIGTVLVDGMFRGLWRRTPDGLAVQLFRPVPTAELTALEEEGERLLAFLDPDQGPGDVVVTVV